MNWQGFSAQSAHRIWRDFIGYGAHLRHCFLFPFISISIWILKQRYFFFLLWVEGSCLLVVKNFQISSQNVFVASRLFLCQSCLSVWVALSFVSCSVLSHPLSHSLTHRQQSAFAFARFTEIMLSSGLSDECSVLLISMQPISCSLSDLYHIWYSRVKHTSGFYRNTSVFARFMW